MLTAPLELSELLSAPIDTLAFSDAFKTQSRAMGYARLQDIVATKERTLMAHPHFNYVWLSELAQFAVRNEFVHLLEAEERF